MTAAGGGAAGPAFPWPRFVAWISLALLMGVSAALIWIWSGHRTLLGDEWAYAYRTSTEPTLQYMFQPPPGKHLIAIPLLLYKGAFEAFGIGSYTPYRLAHLGLLLLCAGLFYALARRRVGDAIAVLPAAILLFLGTSWEVVATPLRIPSLIAIAAGLAMLLALERRDFAGDVAAFALLSVSLASHSTSLAFATAAVVLVLSRPAHERWRSLWTVVLPLFAYGLWWVLEFDPGQSESLASTIGGTPAYLAKSVEATLEGTFGFGADFTSYLGLRISHGVKYAILAVLVAAFAVVLCTRLLRGSRVSPFTRAMAAALVAFWVLTNFAPGPERIAWAPRYLYPDALFFLLLLCGLAQGSELPRRLAVSTAVAVLFLLAVSLAGNVYLLHFQEQRLDRASDNERAALTAIDLAPPADPWAFSINLALAGTFAASQPVVRLPQSQVDAVLADYGSPAYSVAELSSQPQAVRLAADYISLRTTAAQLRAIRRIPAPTGPTPREGVAFGGKWQRTSRGCLALRASSAFAMGVLSLPGGRLALAVAKGPAVSVRVGRFSDGATIPVGSVKGGSHALLRLPENERVSQQWRVAIRARQAVLACGA